MIFPRSAALALHLMLLSLIAAPALAILPAAPTPAASTAAPLAETSAIATAQGANSDQQIAERITSIFAEVPSLAGVEVRAEEGVVTLSGTVGSPEAQARAEAIATRVEGVATVENLVERDVSVDTGLGLGNLSGRIDGFVNFLPLIGVSILVALVIAGFGYALASLTGIWHRLAPNSFLAELIASAIRFVFIVGGLVIALDMTGASALLGAVLGGAGVIGVALGFAMRDTIENYVASLMLSLRQPFRPNDHVVIDTYEGRVIRLTSRATILMTLDGNHLRIPNSSVFKAVILNYTRNPQRRFELDLGIDADDNPDDARALGREALGTLPWVLDLPPPEARVVEVGDSNIVLKFLGWIDQNETDWFKARSGAIARVKAALEEAGFALPEPIYRLRFDQRTGPLPFENIGGQAGEQGTQAGDAKTDKVRSATSLAVTVKGKTQSSCSTFTDEDDVRPENDIARMVDHERASTPDEMDLLDTGRPVE